MRRLPALLHRPFLRRVAWYGSRIRERLDRRLVFAIVEVYLLVALGAAALVTLASKPLTIDSYFHSFYWAFTTAIGSGEAGYVTEPIGWLTRTALVIWWLLTGAVITGAIVAVIIDFILKEGQGLGASGYRGHIVICGWNPTAREIIEELRGDDYRLRVVVICEADRNPAGEGTYFVRGDPSRETDLKRANIEDAAAALIFPETSGPEADMHSILTVMAIESMAPQVRTVAEVNDPRNVDHFLRAKADEVLVTSRLASRLLARSALYPGLTTLVTDIVSGGTGSELYRVALPEEYLGLTIDELSTRLRSEHRATLLALGRGSQTIANPPTDFKVQAGDALLVVAESLASLAPLAAEPASGAPPTELDYSTVWVSGPPTPDPAG